MDPQQLQPDDTIGPMVLEILFPMFALAVLVWAVRIGSRLSPKIRLTPADLMITIALVAEATALGLMAAAVSFGWGRHTWYVAADEKRTIQLYGFFAVLTGSLASSAARVSITCLLLQFAVSKLWRTAVWIAMALIIASFFAFEFVWLLGCLPVNANWEPVAGPTRCLSSDQYDTALYSSMVVSIVSDLVCAALPMLIIWRLSRSAVERALVSFLMASNLIATAAVGVKIYYQAACKRQKQDELRVVIPGFLWCRIEEIIILIAACAPLLKTPIERVLHRLGFPTFHNTPRELNILSSLEEPQDSGRDRELETKSTDHERDSSPAGT